MRSNLRGLTFVVVAAFLGVSLCGVAQGKQDYGSNCLSCHGSLGGEFNIAPSDVVEVAPGESMQIAIDVTDMPGTKASLRLTGLDDPDLGASIGEGWNDYGSYIATDSFSATGQQVLDLTVDPGAKLGDYDIDIQMAGKGGGVWGSTGAFVVSVVPEPATICLLGLGGLALVRRKRKKA